MFKLDIGGANDPIYFDTSEKAEDYVKRHMLDTYGDLEQLRMFFKNMVVIGLIMPDQKGLPAADYIITQLSDEDGKNTKLEIEVAELKERQLKILEVLDAYHRYAACSCAIEYNIDALELRNVADYLFQSILDEIKLDKKRPDHQGGESEGDTLT